MRVIITGANGFVGSMLVEKFAKNNIDVLAIDINFNGSRIKENNHVKTLSLDLNDVKSLVNLVDFGDYQVFYHLAWRGVNGKEKNDFFTQISNINIALKSASVAKEIGCSKFLCAGTIAEKSVDSLDSVKKISPSIVYGSAKQSCHLMLETYCKSIGLDFVWMQFSNIYGVTNNTGNIVSYTLNQLSKNEEATFGPAKQIYDLVYVDDLLEAVYRLGTMKLTQNYYFIGSGNPMILSDYLNIIGEVTEKKELIKIGLREDDGIKYTSDMFDTARLVKDIGYYTSGDFKALIKRVINGD